ncbi:SDR family NAD(P)-dependent oxidoreductase [Paenibacillus sp. MWE-103]|uniref:SDR family NAD(P)-dependent oxidoreductase n=1 Tax=Paenibacillus artemisiicola TaxID=1172618 RepID=A0ABS3W4M4_9BACL|nr:oxidoreductase [Paenibacillus artemisiicola]MBO7743126.1 SDR family NAD(P)-dependent oxidoreductase [Paenibacillus artemisiicola]
MRTINGYPITPQQPIPSGFGHDTTATEALGGRDLTGKTAIVTGGYSGIGLETVRVLAKAGATVVVPARTLEKARTSLAGIPRVELEELDLINPASVDAFARRFLDSGRQLDILVNSAGIMATPLARDAREYESQFATNHLGHFQLAARLWPALKQSGGARVVAVSSGAARLGGVDFDDPIFERREYDKWIAYAQSKSANALFAVELDKRGYASGVRAFSVHPGIIETDLTRHLSNDEIRAGRRNSNLKTPEQGAATSVWCAASAQLDGKGGVYCENVDIAKVVPADTPMGQPGVMTWAIDPVMAERLWQLSEDMTGINFET